jgi:predicted N-formylglutamate amidohydrolase
VPDSRLEMHRKFDCNAINFTRKQTNIPHTTSLQQRFSRLNIRTFRARAPHQD